MIVYSITSTESFKEVTGIRERVLKVKDKDSYPMILLGNKCDLSKDRVISIEDGQTLALKFGIPFKECSARSRINIDESFEEIIRIVLKAKEEGLYGSSPGKNENSFVPELSGKKSKGCTLL